MTRLKDVTITATIAKGHSPLSFVSKSYRAMDLKLKNWKDCAKSIGLYEDCTLNEIQKFLEKVGWRISASFVQSQKYGIGEIEKYWVAYGYIKSESDLEKVITINDETHFTSELEAKKGMIYYMWSQGISCVG